MGTRSQLRLVSLLLKAIAALVFVVMVVINAVLRLSSPFMLNWLQTVYAIGSELLSGLLFTLLAYGGAKVIDLLLSMEGDVRSVALVVQQSRRRRESAREDLAPTAPDPNRHIWSDHPGSIRDGRNLDQPTYNVFGQRIYRGKPKGIRRTE